MLVHGVTASTRTWWRVGPWFAENGWRAVAVDLRGHGASPRMRGDEGLDDLAGDLHETVFEGPGAPDVLLSHSLGALVALKLCEDHGGVAAAGHGVHRDDFEGYVGLLGGWLGKPGV